MEFETYLISKKIDPQAFQKAEPQLFNHWKQEFELMHPKSFTAQKLNLINPVRRKYLLKESIDRPEKKDESPALYPAVPKTGKPVIKPKPKF